ncbi:MAG: cytochrome c551/c552, partial [Granulosicoccus sp.]
KDAYRTFGLENYAKCELTNTDDVKSYLLAEPVAPRVIEADEKGKLAYYGVCSGCHAYDVRMIGPPTQVIQALYANNPQGIADYIAAPIHKREDYPEMPPQNYLSEETRLAVAEFMLTLEK